MQRKIILVCQPTKTTMKSISFFVLLATLVISCDKPIESDTQFTELSFAQTSTPANVAVNQNIVSSVRVMGPDLCYRFAYFTVNPQQFVVDIHAIGTYPTKPGGCATAIYYKDTTLVMQPNVAGKYVLRFYNGNQLFKADTVQAN
ncbi:MAG TPA: hypothetical protein VNT20_22865 [Flavisolibacter sp.]|jgi:hypothetical protein|nr:hypothetical protein [Flavisolibacter sp.]